MPDPPSSAARWPGRPRRAETRTAILEAALSLVQRDGFRTVTMQAIAEQAGASTATIYRRWPNKAAVVMDAFLEFNESLVAFGEGRDIVSTIADQMRLLIIAFQGQMGETLRALVGEAQFDPELADALRERWLRPRRRAARAVLQHAVDRGELPDQDLELLLDTLYGHVYYRLLLRTSPLDPGAAEHVVTRVLLP